MAPERKDKKRKFGLFTSLIVGGAIGSVASLLFAPESGASLRKKMATKIKKIHERPSRQ